MSDGRRSRCNPAPTHASQPQQLRDASELLASVQSRLDALDEGSEETRRIAHEMQRVIEEIRRALGDASHG